MVAMAHLYGFDQRFFGGPVLSKWTLLGVAGVDLFFVLSGFIMVFKINQGTTWSLNNVLSFLFGRFSRIYPLWWFALGVVSAVWIVRPTWVFANISIAPNLLADFFLWPHQRPPLLAVGWTLTHEIYFYIMFALLLLSSRRIYILLTWMIFVIVGNLIISLTDGNVPFVLRLITHPMTIEFVLGMLVGVIYKSGYRPVPLLSVLIGTTWMLFFGVFVSEAPLLLFESMWSRVLILGFGWSLIVYGMVGLETDMGQVPLRIFHKLGDASYSLYLFHVPVFGAIARVLSSFCTPDPWDNIVAWILSLAAAIIAALLSYRYIEIPILQISVKLRKRWISKNNILI
jgi:exopolysaccharide production protein ExoZ